MVLSPWQAARRAGLSSSDLASILNRSDRRSALMVQREKLGLLPDPDATPTTEDQFWGNTMEPLVARTFASRIGARLIEPERWAAQLAAGTVHAFHDGRKLRHMTFCAQRPVCRSTPDYLLELDTGEIALVEVKTTGRVKRWSRGVPVPIMLQTQWHLLCTGLELAFVPVLFFAGTRRLRYWTVRRAPEFAGPESIAARTASEWWQRHVVEAKPITPCALDIPWLTEQHPHGDGRTVILPSDLATLDTQYLETRKVRDEAKLQFDRAERPYRDVEAQLRAAIGSATFASIDGLDGVSYSLYTGPNGGRVLRRKARP